MSLGLLLDPRVSLTVAREDTLMVTFGSPLRTNPHRAMIGSIESTHSLIRRIIHPTPSNSLKPLKPPPPLNQKPLPIKLHPLPPQKRQFPTLIQPTSRDFLPVPEKSPHETVGGDAAVAGLLRGERNGVSGSLCNWFGLIWFCRVGREDRGF